MNSFFGMSYRLKEGIWVPSKFFNFKSKNILLGVIEGADHEYDVRFCQFILDICQVLDLLKFQEL